MGIIKAVIFSLNGSLNWLVVWLARPLALFEVGLPVWITGPLDVKGVLAFEFVRLACLHW